MNNPLTVLPPQVRKYVYAVFAVAAIGLGVYQATGGDWLQFAVGLLAALGFGTATANTSRKGWD